MNRYTRLPLLAFGLLLAAGCSDLFHEEGLDGMRPDDRVGDLVATRAVEEGTDTMHFPTGSLYRLFAFTQTYDEAAPDTYEPATMLRFDQLASEQETGEANHKYIKVANVNTDFSFNPSNDREKRQDPSAKRTIDFYGFTYDGENHYPAKDTKENFVPLQRTAGASADGDDPASYYYETPDLSKQDGNGFPKDSLRDLMWGRLLNQNVKTALPHCHIPFQHVFSQLTFEVMQQENPDEKGKGLYDISIADISLTNIYSKGQVNLKTGRLTVTGAPCTTRIHPDVPELLTSPIPVTSSRFSTSLVFPTHGDSYDLASGITAPGGNETYALQAQVTLRGDKYVLNRFAMKAYGRIDEVVPVPNNEDTATLVLPSFELPRTVQSADEPGETKLYLRAGYSYTVRISFLEYGVFIVTQIPQKVRWIHGEGEENGVGDGSDGVFDYQLLATGNPVYFGGSVWMDRNLGAEEWDASDPETDPDRLQGYYYQPGRNVPYWPFHTADYKSSTSLPTVQERWKVPLVNTLGTGYNTGQMKFFPVLPDYMVRTAHEKWFSLNEGSWEQWWQSTEVTNYQSAANEVVEKEVYDQWTKGGANSQTYMRAAKYPRKRWEDGPSQQPVPPGWRVPTMDDYLQIYPSCSAAGNYAFMNGPTRTSDLQWSDGMTQLSNESVLRVCIPFYRPGMPKPSASKKDKQGNPYLPCYNLWEQLHEKYGESGNYPSARTWNAPDVDYANGFCPAYDPAPGQVSVYLIVRKQDAIGSCIEPEEIRQKIATNKANNIDVTTIQKWGTVYAIKALHTPEAYAMRWRLEVSPKVQTVTKGREAGQKSPVFYLRIDRYKLSDPVNADLTSLTYEHLVDWSNPSATMFLPVTGMANLKSNDSGLYYYGIESVYLTSTMTDEGYFCVWFKAPWGSSGKTNVRIGMSPLKPFNGSSAPGINNFTGELRLIKR